MKRNCFGVLLLLLLLVGCKKNEEVVSQGSFSLDGTSYSVTAVHINHVSYADTDSSDFILKASFTGYQGKVYFYMVAPDNDFIPGQTYARLFADSLSQVVVLSREGDTTQIVKITAATLRVDSVTDKAAAGKNYLQYGFTLVTDKHGTIEGSFLGQHTVNYTVDQPSFGNLSFDTIVCGLAKLSIYRWGRMFSDNTNFFELKFFSSSARFNDNGKIKEGVQFVVGLHSFQELYPAVGNYPVSLEAEEQTAYYGHKKDNAQWGTYWQTFHSSSIIGKANIISDTLHVVRCTADSITLRFDFKDQLGNRVVGSYDGKYY